MPILPKAHAPKVLTPQEQPCPTRSNLLDILTMSFQQLYSLPQCISGLQMMGWTGTWPWQSDHQVVAGHDWANKLDSKCIAERSSGRNPHWTQNWTTAPPWWSWECRNWSHGYGGGSYRHIVSHREQWNCGLIIWCVKKGHSGDILLMWLINKTNWHWFCYYSKLYLHHYENRKMELIWKLMIKNLI